MEAYMTPERKEYVEKLGSQVQVVDRILKMNAGTVISPEQRKQLRELKAEAETVLRKLKNDEFEVAIVGMEKAGKSTFANALMENNLLPSKDLRCTFTSTRIEYSGDDHADSAQVSFYSSDEFNKDFKDKLSKLGFPNYERYSFDTLDERTYQSLYDSNVSDEKKRLYGDSLHADILSVIRNSASLGEHLGRPTISFAADRINSGELTAYITDESKARAVKQVVIRSGQLRKMKNAIIFDVPGFNSPTDLHRSQTLERMKSADAIIVVANGMSPSLTVESLKILRESDDDGNPLKDKLFVFANKIEGARDIAQNIQDTYVEWTSKGFIAPANKQRIIFGSALSHLQTSGLDSEDRTLRAFKEREGQLPNGDGIEEMRKGLAAYNQNERFEVLKRRINRINSDIKKMFSDINSRHDGQALEHSYSAEQISRINGFIYDVRNIADRMLKDLRFEIKKIEDIKPSERPLSKQILDYISAKVTTSECGISDEIIDSASKESTYAGNFEDVARIEGKVRVLKFNEMYDDFSKHVFNIADNYHKENSAKIVDIILSALGVEATTTPFYDQLKELLKKEIAVFRSDLLADDHSNELYYQSLIERYSRDIYEVLIASQYSSERLRQFYHSIDNFYSLSVFYRKPDCEHDYSYIDTAPKDQPLCRMLLFHEYLHFDETLQSLASEICRLLNLRVLSDDVTILLEKALSALCGRKDAIVNEVTKVANRALDKSEEFKNNLLKQILDRIKNANESCSISDEKAFTDSYKRYHDDLRPGLYSVDDFRADFDVDIQILQDVLTNAFVRAIKVEKPFVAREIKSIDGIIKYIKDKSFGNFVINNYYMIKHSECQFFDKQRHEQEQNARIVAEISSQLNALK